MLNSHPWFRPPSFGTTSALGPGRQLPAGETISFGEDQIIRVNEAASKQNNISPSLLSANTAQPFVNSSQVDVNRSKVNELKAQIMAKKAKPANEARTAQESNADQETRMPHGLAQTLNHRAEEKNSDSIDPDDASQPSLSNSTQVHRMDDTTQIDHISPHSSENSYDSNEIRGVAAAREEYRKIAALSAKFASRVSSNAVTDVPQALADKRAKGVGSFPDANEPDIDLELQDWLELTNYHDAEYRTKNLQWWREKLELDKQQQALDAKYAQWEQSRKSFAADIAMMPTPRVSVAPHTTSQQNLKSDHQSKPTENPRTRPEHALGTVPKRLPSPIKPMDAPPNRPAKSMRRDTGSCSVRDGKSLLILIFFFFSGSLLLLISDERVLISTPASECPSQLGAKQ